MSTITLTPEQEQLLEREGVVELPDVVVMTPTAYKRDMIRRRTRGLLPDPPLESVEIDPPCELPFPTGPSHPVESVTRAPNSLLPDRYVEDE